MGPHLFSLSRSLRGGLNPSLSLVSPPNSLEGTLDPIGYVIDQDIEQ